MVEVGPGRPDRHPLRAEQTKASAKVVLPADSSSRNPRAWPAPDVRDDGARGSRLLLYSRKVQQRSRTQPFYVARRHTSAQGGEAVTGVASLACKQQLRADGHPDWPLRSTDAGQSG
jgi:hypothetical protein